MLPFLCVWGICYKRSNGLIKKGCGLEVVDVEGGGGEVEELWGVVDHEICALLRDASGGVVEEGKDGGQGFGMARKHNAVDKSGL